MGLRALVRELGADATTAEAVYRALRHGIVHGDLAPGQRLRSDALATEMRVSRTPVREALRKLEVEGLVAHSGPRLVVRELSEQDLTELFYVREALEGMAARLAAENATPSEIAQIRELLDHTSGLRDFFFGAGVDHALLSKPTRIWDPARRTRPTATASDLVSTASRRHRPARG